MLTAEGEAEGTEHKARVPAYGQNVTVVRGVAYSGSGFETYKVGEEK